MLVRQKITKEREKLGLSTRQLADMLAVNRGTVSRWENGYIKSIPADILEKLAELFQISLDELIDSDPQYSDLRSSDFDQPALQLSSEENAMICWFRNLTRKEQKLISRLWSQNN